LTCDLQPYFSRQKKLRLNFQAAAISNFIFRFKKAAKFDLFFQVFKKFLKEI